MTGYGKEIQKAGRRENQGGQDGTPGQWTEALGGRPDGHCPGVAEGKEGKTTERWPEEREGQAKGQQIQASRSAEEQSQEVQDPAATEEADGSGVPEAGQETEPQD